MKKPILTLNWRDKTARVPDITFVDVTDRRRRCLCAGLSW